MEKHSISKYLPLVLVIIALVLGLSYFHESGKTTEVRDEIQSGLSAPQHSSEIPL
jgi:hypothetical protein